ncbi:2OG-Fe(II) oxygenase superfamily protein [Balamuthia mandrillaris]
MEKKEEAPQPPLKRFKREANEEEEEEEEEAEEVKLKAAEGNEESTLLSLAALIDRLPETTNTSVGGPALRLPAVAGLVVKGREIPLPLHPSDASFLQAEGSVSPHGRGMETVVDTRVRSSKEFNPTDFAFTHPQWDVCVAALAQEVATQLGATGCKVEARPDHFLPHRDTEKEKGMFATLIIQLPSRCQGGALVVSQGGVRQTYDFGESSGMAAFQCHFAGHYADVEHEVKEVTSGHRLAVGKDRVLGSILHSANSLLGPEHKLSLFLATVDHTVTFDTTYHGYSEDWKKADIDEQIHWYSAVGQPVKFDDLYIGIEWETDVASMKYLDAKHIFSFEGKTEEEEYTGNEGAYTSTTYHRSVLVLWPEATELRVRMKFGGLLGAVQFVLAAKDNKEDQLKKVEQVLEMWATGQADHTSIIDSTIEGAALLLQCLPSGDFSRLLRVLDLIQTIKPAYKLEDLGEQISRSISDEQCASSDTVFQKVKEIAVSWVKQVGDTYQYGIKASSKLLETVVQTNATPTRALQMVDAFTPLLKEVEAEDSKVGSYSYKERFKTQQSALQPALKLLIEKWAWPDISQHVMTLLHAAPSFFTLRHRLSLAQSLTSTAPIAAQTIAQDAIDDVLQMKEIDQYEGKQRKLDMIYVPALVLCATLDDVEHGQQVCDLVVREAGRTEAIRYLDDKSLFGAWPVETPNFPNLTTHTHHTRTTGSAHSAPYLPTWPSFSEKLLRTLLAPRIQELERLVARGPPQFTWVQHPSPAQVTHPQLLSFLQGPQQSTVIHGLGGIGVARHFVAQYSSGRGYSAKLTALGQGTTARVSVEKTRECYDLVMNTYKQNYDELIALRSRVAQSESKG